MYILAFHLLFIYYYRELTWRMDCSSTKLAKTTVWKNLKKIVKLLLTKKGMLNSKQFLFRNTHEGKTDI